MIVHNIRLYLRNLSLGKRIALYFSLAALAFIVILGQYFFYQNSSEADYRALREDYESRKRRALQFDLHVSKAEQTINLFLLKRRPEYIQKANRHIDQAFSESQKLARIGAESRRMAGQLLSHISIYRSSFQKTVEAWEKKGLDHTVGSQGRFRRIIHRLQDMAQKFQVGEVYLEFLRLRRLEPKKTLTPKQVQTIQALFRHLHKQLENMAGNKQLRQKISAELKIYQTLFSLPPSTLEKDEKSKKKGRNFKKNWQKKKQERAALEKEQKQKALAAGERIDQLFRGHFIPNLEVHILELRRREKDYLLRGNKSYVYMALRIIERLRTDIHSAGLSAEHKENFLVLLKEYESDFLALVAQNDQIIKRRLEMQSSLRIIENLVEEILKRADQNLESALVRLETEHKRDTWRLLIGAVIAFLVVTLFGVAAARRSLRELQRLLLVVHRLAEGDYRARVKKQAKGRVVLPAHYLSGKNRNELRIFSLAINMMAKNIEQHIASMEERALILRGILDAPSDAIFLIDSAGQILDTNQSALRRFNLTKQAESHSIFNLFSATSAQRFRERLKDVTMHHRSERFEDQRQGKFCEIRIHPLLRESDNLRLAVFFRDITRYRHSEQAGLESEQRFRTVINHAPVVMFALDPDCCVTFLGGKGLDAMSLLPDQSIGKSIFTLFGDLPAVRQDIRQALSGQNVSTLRTIRGSVFEGTYMPTRNDEGSISGVFGVWTKMTETDRDEGNIPATVQNFPPPIQSVEAQIQVVGQLFANATVGMIVSDSQQRITMVNSAFSQITGFSAEEIVGQTMDKMAANRPEKARYKELWEQMKRQEVWQGELWNRHKTGRAFPERLAVTALRNSQGSVAYHVSIFQDLTTIYAQEGGAVSVTNHDPLTELPNCRLITDRLKVSISLAQRTQTRIAALLF
ncbi:PAS domain S-box protein, partial [Magnetococcales bacterium HHB-1]